MGFNDKNQECQRGLFVDSTFTVWDKISPQLNFNRLIFKYLILSLAVSNNKNT